MARTLADILRDALADADARGVRSPTIARLSDGDVQALAEQTLAFLRTRPSTESPIPGWRQVGSFEAGVNRWWNQQIDSPAKSDTAARLRKLRAQTYDYLDDALGLISKAPGQNAPIHLAPVGDVVSPDVVDNAPKHIFIGPQGAGFGDPEKNRAVENAAMDRVIQHFADWAYVDMSLKKVGWDITFTRGSEERHVEVKGVSGRKPSVLLTRNEVDTAAADPLWCLVVVTQALVAPVVHEFGRDAVAQAASPYVYRAEMGLA